MRELQLNRAATLFGAIFLVPRNELEVDIFVGAGERRCFEYDEVTFVQNFEFKLTHKFAWICLLYTSPSPRDS